MGAGGVIWSRIKFRRKRVSVLAPRHVKNHHKCHGKDFRHTLFLTLPLRGAAVLRRR